MAPASQMATTHGSRGSGNARGAPVRSHAVVVVPAGPEAAGEVAAKCAATGAIDAVACRSRLQVISGAAAMTASAAHASAYRVSGPAECDDPLADCRIHGCDQDALPEEVEQRPAETFDPRLGREELDRVHLDPRFFLSNASIIWRISASSSADAG